MIRFISNDLKEKKEYSVKLNECENECEEVAELQLNQEEADTRLLLDAHHASMRKFTEVLLFATEGRLGVVFARSKTIPIYQK